MIKSLHVYQCIKFTVTLKVNHMGCNDKLLNLSVIVFFTYEIKHPVVHILPDL